VLSRVARDHWTLGSITNCFEAKRRTRSLERAYRAACQRQTAQHNIGSFTGVDDDKAAWYAQRCSYHDCARRSAVPSGVTQSNVIESRQGNYGGRLTSCSTVDVLQRVRASLLTNSAVFSEKVNAVRSSTDGAQLKLAVVVHCVPRCSRHCTAVSV